MYIILSVGAMQSPQILELLGIRPGDLLESHDITILFGNPKRWQEIPRQFYVTCRVRSR